VQGPTTRNRDLGRLAADKEVLKAIEAVKILFDRTTAVRLTLTGSVSAEPERRADALERLGCDRLGCISWLWLAVRAS
jgi:hypothetical protein